MPPATGLPTVQEDRQARAPQVGPTPLPALGVGGWRSGCGLSTSLHCPWLTSPKVWAVHIHAHPGLQGGALTGLACCHQAGRQAELLGLRFQRGGGM